MLKISFDQLTLSPSLIADQRDDAATRLSQSKGLIARDWETLIDGDSAVGVSIARIL